VAFKEPRQRQRQQQGGSTRTRLAEQAGPASTRLLALVRLLARQAAAEDAYRAAGQDLNLAPGFSAKSSEEPS
jgi:hypothetical protein